MSTQEKFNAVILEKSLDNDFYGQMTEFANTFIKQKQRREEIIQQPNNAKKRGAFYRWRTTENLDKYLIEFESNYSSPFTAKISNLTFIALNNFCFFLARSA